MIYTYMHNNYYNRMYDLNMCSKKIIAKKIEAEMTHDTSTTYVSLLLLWILIIVLQTVQWTAASRSVKISNECNNISVNSSVCIDFAKCFTENTTCFKSYTTYAFASGEYTLGVNSLQGVFVTRSIASLKLVSLHQSNAYNTLVTLHCNNYSSFAFMNITNLTISGIRFSSCGGVPIARFVVAAMQDYTHSFFTVPHDMRAAVFLINIRNLNTTDISVYQSNGVGLLAINILGYSALNNTVLSKRAIQMDRITDTEAGNAIFLYTDTNRTCTTDNTEQTMLTISDATMSFGVSLQHNIGSRSYDVPSGGGLSITLAQTDYNISIQLTRVTAHDNLSLQGANILVCVYEHTNSFHIDIQDSTVKNANKILFTLNNTEGGGLYYIHGLQPPKEYVPHFYVPSAIHTMSIMNSVFTNNHARIGGGVKVSTLNRGLESMYTLVLQNCTFLLNIAEYGSAVYIEQDPFNKIKDNILSLTINISDSIFSRNNEHKSMHFSDIDDGSTFQVLYTKLSLDNCLFEENYDTAISIIQSTLTLYNTNRFLYNIGLQGGALAFYEDRQNPLCRIQFISQSENKTAQIEMRDNYSVMKKGSSIYGAVTNCRQVHLNMELSLSIFQNLYNTDINFTDPLQTDITSDPTTVCFCVRGIPDCSINTQSGAAYAGQLYKFPVASVGAFHGIVEAVITAEISPDYNIFNNRKTSTKVSAGCTDIALSIQAISIAHVYFYIEAHRINLYSFTAINIVDCTLGFTLDRDARLYKCELKFRNHCNTELGTITRTGTEWVGYDKNSTLFHPFCPSYCNMSELSLKLDMSDIQCNYNRTGVLCGQCKQGHSLILGGEKCKKCTNNGLALVVFFALAGIILVALLSLLDLTVAKGSVNALIIYTNIVQMNKTLFFPANTNGNTASSNFNSFLSIFIAWFNLDIGFETCFHHNMTAFESTLFQVAFPLYIWLITAAIIIGSRHTTIIAKVCGSNGVQVLATLFLLSYAKLLRMVIDALTCTSLQYTDGHSLRWLRDANIVCFAGKHLALTFMAVGISVFFIIPVTLFLLFSRQLQAVSTRRMFQWVNKLKPLVDSYQGPYKPKYRYWLGVMLLAQIILFIAFTANVASNPAINYLLIALVMSLILPWSQRIYKNMVINILEFATVLNLDFLATLSLFMHSQSKKRQQHVITDISVGISLLMFIMILITHSVFKMKNTLNVYLRRRAPIQVPRASPSRRRGSDPDPSTHTVATTTVSWYQSSGELREPLIESTEYTHS